MPNGMPHTLANFESALTQFNENVLTMASTARQNLKNAVEGLLTRNAELCAEAIADDDDVNNLERTIDREGFEILMRYNPVAGDLRQVLAGMKIANNLERVSDQAESIARRARKILKHPELPEVSLVEPIHQLADQLLAESAEAYAAGEVERSLALYQRDEELDKLHRKAIKELTKAIESNTAMVKPYLHLIFIVRCLERVGDHSVNIAEDTVFSEKAADIRHLGPEETASLLDSRS